MPRIRILKHSVEAEKKELFCLIGEYFASALVHKELGEAMVSDEKYTWFVAMNSDSVQGFAAVKVMKSGSEFSYWWVLPEHRKNGVSVDLFAAAMDYLEALEVSKIEATVSEARLETFKKAGFEKVSQRGRWIRVRKGPH